MQFEFDPDKSEKNKEKHGIDFVNAQDLWKDSKAIGFPARSDDEVRYAMIAELEGVLWVVFYTIRDERIRLISVRRVREGEKGLYES